MVTSFRMTQNRFSNLSLVFIEKINKLKTKDIINKLLTKKRSIIF